MLRAFSKRGHGDVVRKCLLPISKRITLTHLNLPTYTFFKVTAVPGYLAPEHNGMSFRGTVNTHVLRALLAFWLYCSVL